MNTQTEMRQTARLLDEAERAERVKAELRRQEILDLFDQQQADDAEPVGLGDWDAPELPELATGEEDQLVLECQLDALKLFGEEGLNALQEWMESGAAKPKGTARRVVEVLQGKAPATARRRKNKNKAEIRRLEGKSDSPDESRVYLTEEERALPLDRLREHLKSRGFEISRATVWRAKQSGYFRKPGREWLGGGKKVHLTDEEKALDTSTLARRRGISPLTARRALNRGWFMLTKNNKKAAHAESSRVSEEERQLASLPEKLTEIAGRKISEWHAKELCDMGVVANGNIRGRGGAQDIVNRGYMKPRHGPRTAKLRLSKILKELEDFVWEPLPEPEIVVPPYLDGLDELREHLFKEEGVYIRNRKVLERIKRDGYLTITGRMRRKS